MTTIDFVMSILDRILAVQGPSSLTSDFEKFAKVLDQFSPYTRTFVAFISRNPTNEWHSLLVGLVHYWFKCAAEKFPKTAMGLPNAEIQYQKTCIEYKSTIYMPQWKDQYQAVRISNEMDRSMFGRLGNFSTIYFSWNGLAW